MPSEGLYFTGLLGATMAGLWLPLDGPDTTPSLMTGPQWMLHMAKAEPLISAVEQWQQAPWHLAPDPKALVPFRASCCEAVVCAPALAPAGTRLQLPWSALGRAAPAGLQAPHVAWPSVAAEVCIDSLPSDELQHLTEGGLLWLDPSFSRSWAVVVRDPQRRLPERSGEWRCVDASQGAFVLNPPGPICQAATRQRNVLLGTPMQADVVLAAPLSVPLPHWLGWSSSSTPPAVLPLEAYKASVQVRKAGVVYAHGELLPLGAGHAFKALGVVTEPDSLGSRAH